MGTIMAMTCFVHMELADVDRIDQQTNHCICNTSCAGSQLMVHGPCDGNAVYTLSLCSPINGVEHYLLHVISLVKV